jgi:hypothetical protein
MRHIGVLEVTGGGGGELGTFDGNAYIYVHWVFNLLSPLKVSLFNHIVSSHKIDLIQTNSMALSPRANYTD